MEDHPPGGDHTPPEVAKSDHLNDIASKYAPDTAENYRKSARYYTHSETPYKK